MATRQAGSWAPNARSDAAVTWQGLNSDGTGVVFDGGDFSAGRFSSEIVLFTGAEFSGGMVSFSGVGRRSHPPMFGRDGEPPTEVVLPVQATEARRVGQSHPVLTLDWLQTSA
jgi:hypothetical protein